MPCRDAAHWLFCLERNYSWQSPHVFHRDWAFQDKNGHTRLILTTDGIITVTKDYAWDGATPKTCAFDLVLGTPDGVVFLGTGKPKVYYASLVHDALYQFLPEGPPLTRAQADRCFLLLMHEHRFSLARLYWAAVRVFGGLSWRITRRFRATFNGRKVDCTALCPNKEDGP
jgi:hypothetical protein